MGRSVGRVPRRKVNMLGRTKVVAALPAQPLRYAFLATLGVGAGLATLTALTSLSTVLVHIGIALFISIAMEPVLQWGIGKGIARPWATTMVVSAFFAVFAGASAAVLPALTEQVSVLTSAVVEFIVTVPQQPWFIWISENGGDFIDVHVVIDRVAGFAANPDQILAFAGGILQIGSGLIDGVTGLIVVSILSLYFSLSMPRFKEQTYSLIARSRRDRVVDLTEEIFQSVGRYVGGQALLAGFNAAFTFLLTTLLDSPAPLLLAAIAFVGALIPVVGPLIGSAIAVLSTLSVSPIAALVAAGVLLVYLQVEAYFLTPKVMVRAVAVPGALVIIAALSGAALGGILGALVAVPVAAAGLLILERVIIPRQQRA